jgi:hypothetical protein
MSHARELLAACTPAIEAYPLGGNDIAITQLKQRLTEAVRVRKRAAATAVLSAELGITYDEVFNWSQAHPDDPTWRGAWERIRRIDLGAALIVGTFTDDECAILTIEPTGEIVWTDHYAAVGTGSGIASAFLHQRDYDDDMAIEVCLYKVLEAKLAAEKNPYVGESTVIELHTTEGTFEVNPGYIQKLENLISNRRKIPKLSEFKAAYLIHVQDPEEEQEAQRSVVVE